MKNNVLIWGYLSSLLLLLGAIFMNLDFVAGKVLFLVSFFTFNLGYLVPLFIVIFKDHQENRIGLIIVLSILGFFIFLMGVTFFMVNWGGSMVLIYVGGSFLLLTVLLMLCMSRRFYETSIDSWFPIVLFSVFIVIGMLTSMVHRPVLRSFTISNEEDKIQLESLDSKNMHVYLELKRICEGDTLLTEYKMESEIIMAKSNAMMHYIDSMKHELMFFAGRRALRDSSVFDNLVPIQSNVEINLVRRFMLGRKRQNAYALHQRIDLYHKEMISMIGDNDPWLSDFVNSNISTEVLTLNKRRYNRNWENQHFYNFPMVTIISQLTGMQLNVALVQGEMLNNCRRKVLEQKINNLNKDLEK